MNTLQATEYMKELFSQFWIKELKYPYAFQNILATTPREDVPFAVFNVQHYSAHRATLNGLNKTKYRQQGYLDIQLFIPSNTGMEQGYDLAEKILNIYRRPPHDCLINFENFSLSESNTIYKNFFKISVSVRFDYDYHF